LEDFILLVHYLEKIDYRNIPLTALDRSILSSTCGTVVIASSHILNHFGNAPTVSLVLDSTSWIFMVTGFACVLYSRLHVIYKNRRVLRCCLAVILVNAILCHPIVIVGSIYSGVHKNLILRFGFYLDGVFVLQEIGLGGCYIFFFLKFVKGFQNEPDAESMLRKLIIAECIVFCIDTVSIGLLYAEFYVPREAITPFCYAVKLKVEFFILNLLVRYSQRHHRSSNADTIEIRGLHK
jgi:hypothetical protein